MTYVIVLVLFLFWRIPLRHFKTFDLTIHAKDLEDLSQQGLNSRAPEVVYVKSYHVAII